MKNRVPFANFSTNLPRKMCNTQVSMDGKSMSFQTDYPMWQVKAAAKKLGLSMSEAIRQRLGSRTQYLERIANCSVDEKCAYHNTIVEDIFCSANVPLPPRRVSKQAKKLVGSTKVYS